MVFWEVMGLLFLNGRGFLHFNLTGGYKVHPANSKNDLTSMAGGLLYTMWIISYLFYAGKVDDVV